MESAHVDVSVVVPIFNTGSHLRECLDALVRQTLRGCEIILIDDGSTDDSPQIADAYARAFANVRVVHQPNQGLSAARNAGLRLARGTYILFVDSDDVIARNSLEVFYTTALATSCDILIGELSSFSVEDFSAWHAPLGKVTGPMSGIEFLCASQKNKDYQIVAVLKAIRREYLIQNNLSFPPGLVFEDHLFSLQLFTAAPCRVMKLQFPFYYYRRTEGSITKSVSLRKVLDLAEIVKRMDAHIKGRPRVERPTLRRLLSLSFFHLGCFWRKLSPVDRLTALRAIPVSLRLRCLQSPYPSFRVAMWNVLFACCPRVSVCFAART